MLATASKKTKTCPYCGTRIDLAKAKRLGRAETAMQASEMLRKLKVERQSNPTTTRSGNKQI